MVFEWDPAKNAANIQKHGIDFADAVAIFDTPTATAEDRRRDYGETRFGSLGVSEDTVLFVVWTQRGDAIRIISARRANAKEISRYDRFLAEG